MRISDWSSDVCSSDLAEESGMAKGKQAAVAEQKIEGTGKQRKAQDLHDEDRIEDKRCDDEQHEKAGEDRHMVPRHALRANGRACRRGDRGDRKSTRLNSSP